MNYRWEPVRYTLRYWMTPQQWKTHAFNGTNGNRSENFSIPDNVGLCGYSHINIIFYKPPRWYKVGLKTTRSLFEKDPNKVTCKKCKRHAHYELWAFNQETL